MDVEFVVGDLLKIEVEAIVNPANSEGEMGGGVAAVIKKKGGRKIEEEAMAQAPIPVGKAIATAAGKLSCEFVVHAPTMKVPVQRTSRENITAAVRAALDVACDYGIHTLALPGMGTGVGRVPHDEAARAMIEALRHHKQAGSMLSRVVFVDREKAMVEAWQSVWQPQPVAEE